MFMNKPVLKPKPRPMRKVSVSQLRVLVSAIERDPSLYNVTESDMISFLNIHRWLDLTDKLNECYGGALLDTQNWKYVLRYWADNVKKGVDVMTQDRIGNKKNRAFTDEEAKELALLEKRFFHFMEMEHGKDVVDVTYTGNFGAEEPKQDISGASDKSIKVKVQLLNIFHATQSDKSVYPKKRTIQVEGDAPVDPANVRKKIKSSFDDNIDDEEPQKQILKNQIHRHEMVSRDLVRHISTVQRRIHTVKYLWMHRCGDN